MQFQSMIKQPYRNRINKQNIIRHTSNVGLVKSAVQQQQNQDTPRDTSREHSKERKSSFWTKKGINGENQQPNTKRMQSSRNLRALSIKVATQASESQSRGQKADVQNQSEDVDNTKLLVIQKSSRQLMTEVRVLVDQQIPKLSTCQQVFESLNKNLKLLSKNIGKSSEIIERIVDQHIQSTSSLFQKILKHINQFTSSTKSSAIIAKNIQLQKQIAKLMDLHMKTQLFQYNRKMKASETNGQTVSYQDIDFQRILISNFRTTQGCLSTSKKTEQFVGKILEPFFGLQKKKQAETGKYQIANEILSELISQKQGQVILKKVITTLRKNNQNTSAYIQNDFSSSHSTLSESILTQVLKVQFDAKILQLVKKKITKLSNLGYIANVTDSKVTIKQLLALANKINFIKDSSKYKQIIINLLMRCRFTNRDKLNQKQIDQISKYIDDGNITMIKNIEPNLGQMQKISKLSNKRLVNCASLCLSKRSLNGPIAINKRKSGIPEVNSQNQQNILKEIYLKLQQCTMFLYLLIVEQFEFTQHSLFTFYRLSYNLDNLQDFNSLMSKVISKEFCNRLTNLNLTEKESLININNVMIHSYDSNYKDECKVVLLKELIKLSKADLVHCLNFDEKKVVLSEILEDPNLQIKSIETSQFCV